MAIASCPLKTACARRFWAALVAGLCWPALASGQTLDALAWDSMSKEIRPKTNDTQAVVAFSVTNLSQARVEIRTIQASCGCTVTKMPAQPWILEPGRQGVLEARTDLRGKRGILNKYLAVDSSAGYQVLHFKIEIPETAAADPKLDGRERNLVAALADRQAVFRGDCARCHALPAQAQEGEGLYQEACAICHEAPKRASMVPDLCGLNGLRNRSYWQKWITRGKVGSLMPAFGRAEGGPLSPEQITSLEDYLLQRFAPPGLPNPSIPKR